MVGLQAAGLSHVRMVGVRGRMMPQVAVVAVENRSLLHRDVDRLFGPATPGRLLFLNS